MQGFNGAACDKLACLPLSSNNCNGRGRCAILLDLQKDEVVRRYGSLSMLPVNESLYTGWDASSYQTCQCDPGYAGPDCGQVLCPAADNPVTQFQQRRVIRVVVDVPTTVAAADRQLRFRLSGWVSRPLDLPSLNSANCLSRLTTGGGPIDAGNSLCRVAGPSGVSSVSGAMLSSTQYEIVLSLSFVSNGASNPMDQWHTFNGNPSASIFSCYLDQSTAASRVVGSLCDVYDVDVTALTLASTSDYSAVATGTTYAISITDENSFPNQVAVTKTVDGSPQTVISYPSIPTSTDVDYGTQINVAENLYLVFGSLWGHALGATWSLTSNGNGTASGVVITQPTYREYDMCGGIGVCNSANGTCACPTGFYGAACEVQSNQNDAAMVAANGDASFANTAPVLEAIARPIGYRGNVLHLGSKRPLSTAFNFLTASNIDDDANGVYPAFAVRGDGSVTSASSFRFDGGGAVNRNLVVSMPAQIASTYAGASVLSVYYGSATVLPPPQASLASIVSEFPIDNQYASAYKPVRIAARTNTSINNQYTDLLSVAGDGRISTWNGIAVTGGGISVNAGGLTVKAGVTSLQGGLSITGGAAVRSGGLSVMGGISGDYAFIYGDVNISGQIVGYGGVSVTSGGLDVATGGIHVGTGGVSITSGGATVTAGGLSVLQGGIFAQNVGAPSTAAVGRIGGGGSGAGGAASFAVTSGIGTGYQGDVVYIEGPAGGTAGAYNLLRLSSTGADSASLLVDKSADITSSDSLLIGTQATSAAGTSSGDISLVAGAAASASAGKIAIVGGAGGTGAGGDAIVKGGASSSSTGGHAYITGGDGVSAGGSVVLQPGSASSGAAGNGQILLKDSTGITRLSIDGSGDITFSPPSSSAAVLSASTAPIITSATILSLTGSTAVVARGGDGVSGSAGAGVSIIGGSVASGSAGAGSVFISPGYSAAGASGTILFRSASSAGIKPRAQISDTATTVLADDGTPSLSVLHGADPTSSGISIGGSTSIAGSLSVGGATTLFGYTHSNGALSIGGAASIAAGLRVTSGAVIDTGGLDVQDGMVVRGTGTGFGRGGIEIGPGGGLSVSANIVGASALSIAGATTLAGAAVLQSGLSVTSGGGTITGAVQVSGSASVSGSMSIGANAQTNGFLTVGGATTIAGGLRVAGASTTATVEGNLDAGFFSSSMLTMCTTSAWASGGACYNLVSADPNNGGSRFKLYWNVDSVSHTVSYFDCFGTDPDFLPCQRSISANAIFPVFY